MAVRIVPERIPDPPCDLVLWRMLKEDRIAHAVIRVLDVGSELRVYVDNELVWSRLLRSEDPRAVANAHRRAFEVRGWSSE